MAQAKLNKRTVDALTPPKSGQAFVWDTEIKGFGVRIGLTVDQAILGHARHKGLLSERPTKGAKTLAGNKNTRRLSVVEIETLGKAMVYAEQQGVSPTGISP